MVVAQNSVWSGDNNWFPQGRGRRRAISRSNSRNKIATRKKRRENGRRAFPRGSKPHSYGDNFSLSGLSDGSQNAINTRIREIRAVAATEDMMRFITFPWVLTKI